jgi:transposase InsO family protein
MRRGFLYLIAIMDWFTRKILAWWISNTLEAAFCLQALNDAIHKFGPPEIMNTDQGSQFTAFDRTNRLKRAKIKMSMDGKARHLDNIFIERLWEIPEIRLRLPARLGNRVTCAGQCRTLDHLLQPPAVPHLPWRTTARRGLLQCNRNRSAGAGSSLNHPGNCPRIGE